MIGQKHCPFCLTPAQRGCSHLALAIEARDFVRGCIEHCSGQLQWEALCNTRRRQAQLEGHTSPEREDFTWLETAFCDQFLRHLSWFGEMDYEWRTGSRPEHGGFWVLLWSKNPERLWWELRDEFERQNSPDIGPSVVSRSDTFLPL